MGCGKTGSKLASQPESIIQVSENAQALYAAPAGPVTAKLDYIYGCNTVRGSVHYLANEDSVAYPCASLAVLIALSSNTQRYLGGGEVRVATGHVGKITALVLNWERNTIATGDTGQLPAICIWKLPGDTVTLTIHLLAETGGVDQIAFSCDSRLVAAIDQVGNVLVYEVKSGKQVFAAPGKPGRPVALSWSPKDSSFCTAGKSHFSFWTAIGTSFSRSPVAGAAALLVVQWTAIGCLAGGKDGKVYVWTEGILSESHQVLAAGCSVQALIHRENTVLVGGTDKCLHVLDAAFHEIRVIETPGVPLSLDICPSGILCGTDEGILLEFGRNGRVVFMDAHVSGRRVAAAMAGNSTFVSVAGDNKVKNWNLTYRKCIVSGLLEVGLKPGAEAISVSVGPQGHVAVGHLDGHLTVRYSANQLNGILVGKKDGSEALSLLKYSPLGSYLAAFSAAGTIFLHNTKSAYALVRTLTNHASEIVAADWNKSGTVLRTQDKVGGIKCWEADTGEDRSTSLPDEWSSDTCRRLSLSLPCAASNNGKVLAQGTEAGVLELSISEDALSAYRVHVGAIRELYWAGSMLVTVGEDGCILQWQVNGSNL